jgi:large subunit ribosomal protein L5
MREILIDKVVVNMGVGGDPEEMTKAQKIIELITKRKAVKTKAKVRAPEWGLRLGLPIGLKVTLRGDAARKFLDDAFTAKDKKINASSFDGRGNFGFGIGEYIDLPNAKYDPKVGIRGFDVLVSLKRMGYRVKLRKIRPARVGKNGLISSEEAIEFVKAMGVEVK